MGWSETFIATLKNNDVRFITYVPDNVLTPLIKGVASDNYFMSVNATREDEAIGMVAGAWMGGLKGAVMMQTSGFAVAPNALASLLVPYQIPAILVISERGTMGEFNRQFESLGPDILAVHCLFAQLWDRLIYF